MDRLISEMANHSMFTQEEGIEYFLNLNLHLHHWLSQSGLSIVKEILLGSFYTFEDCIFQQRCSYLKVVCIHVSIDRFQSSSMCSWVFNVKYMNALKFFLLRKCFICGKCISQCTASPHPVWADQGNSIMQQSPPHWTSA